MKFALFLAFFACQLFLFSFAYGQESKINPAYSLQDNSISAEERMETFYSFIWDDLLYSYPDSAILLSKQLFSFAAKQSNVTFQGKAYNVMGMAFIVAGQSDSAIYYTKKSYDIRLSAKDWEGVAGSLNNLGLMYNYLREDSLAIVSFKESFIIAGKAKDRVGQTNALNNLANIYFVQGNMALAMETYYKTLSIAEDLEDDKLMAQAHGNIGNGHTELMEYRQAIPHYRKSADLFRITEAFRDNALSVNNLATCYLELEIYDSASVYFKEGLKTYQKLADEEGIARVLTNLGLLEKDVGNYEKAMQYFMESLRLKEAIKDFESMSEVLNGIASVHFSTGDSEKGIEFAKRALDLAQDRGSVSNVGLAAERLYKAYKESNQFQDALQMFELYQEMRDSLYSSENQKEFIRQEYKYEYEKQAVTDSIQNAEAQKVKDAEIARQEAEIEAKKKEQFLLFGGLGLVVVFALFIFNRFRVTNKQKKVIEEQKSEVEKQRETANQQRQEAEEQKELVEEKNKEIIDSINYARRLQEAILPPQKLVKEYLPDSFIMYKPKDIVAGDFYWMETAPLFNSPPDGGEMSEGQREAVILFAVADCTGHGVPGAMVSVVCSNALTKVLLEEKITEPGKMLDRTRELVIDQFARSEEEVKDGMDISLCALNLKTRELQWAGANNPLWIVRSKEQSTPVVGTHESRQTLPREYELLEIKADKQPIGKYAGEKPFTTHTIQLNEGDSIYIFSDGYPDQFGGEKGKKYKSGKFKKFILSIVDKPHVEQRQILLEEFENWRGDIEQIDDVCVLGLRV